MASLQGLRIDCLVVMLAVGLLSRFTWEMASAQAGESEITIFKDEPVAHALYDRMIKTIREANSLSFESDYRITKDVKGFNPRHATYRCWLKKPNQFRVEASQFGGDADSGILVGDGEHLWIYWPGGKPRTVWEQSGELAKEYEKHRMTSYMKKRTPQGDHSVLHEVGWLGADMPWTVFELSMFHGSQDLESYLDGVRYSGSEWVGEVECDVIEVSFMKYQRSRYFWLSRKDHLPRKLKQVIRVFPEIITHELWSNVMVNPAISDNRFSWSPPAGWREFKRPPQESAFLKPGTQAPDFELTSVDDETIRLSDFRGNFVLLFNWRVGCQSCLEELPVVQELYAKYRDKGLIVLGVNTCDVKKFVTKVIEQNGVDFPNILDTSPDAVKAMEDYGVNAFPVSYVIDRKGKVMDAWAGYQKGDKRAFEALKEAGLQLEEATHQE